MGSGGPEQQLFSRAGETGRPALRWGSSCSLKGLASSIHFLASIPSVLWRLAIMLCGLSDPQKRGLVEWRQECTWWAKKNVCDIVVCHIFSSLALSKEGRGQDEGHTSSNEPNWKRKDKFLKIEHKFLLIYSEFMHISHTRYNKMSTF